MRDGITDEECRGHGTCFIDISRFSFQTSAKNASKTLSTSLIQLQDDSKLASFLLTVTGAHLKSTKNL